MARRNYNSRRSESAPGWVWMLFGLGLGLAVALGVYLRAPAGATAPARSAAATPAAQSAGGSARTEPTKEPVPVEQSGSRFGFYDILPQVEVAVPEDPPSRAAAARPRPVETPGSYLLQAGSFSAAADADRLQANLALLGFEAHVQRVKLDDDVFNRVRIGPLADLESAKRAQRRLRDAGIDSLLMQVPK